MKTVPTTVGPVNEFGTAASKIEPSTILEAAGYLANQELPAEHMNWFMSFLTKLINADNPALLDVWAELQAVLTAAGLTADNTPGQLLVALSALYGSSILVQTDSVLTNRAIHIIETVYPSGALSLSLPPASVGDTLEVECRSYCKIIQSDSEHVISSYSSLFTTKGISGFVALNPGDKGILRYRGSGFALQNPGVKIADPATLPPGVGYGGDWSPDEKYLAVGHAVSPYITIYSFSTGVPIKIADPASALPNQPNCAMWSPNGRYLAVGHNTTPFITIYDFNTGVPVKLTDPATLPGGAVYGAGWSPDGRYLALGHTLTPWITVYDFSTGAPVKIANPAALPPASGGSFVAYPIWSPDGRYLACPDSYAPYIIIYDWISGSPVKTADPVSAPASSCVDGGWSPDGRYLVFSNQTSPFMTIYDWISGLPVKLPNPSIIPPDMPLAFRWSKDGRFLTFGYTASPRLLTYDWSSGVPVKTSDPVTPPTGAVHGVAWSPTGRYLAAFHSTSPFVSIYDWRIAASKEWMIDISSRGLERINAQSILGYKFK